MSKKESNNGFALSIEGSQKLLDKAKDRKTKARNLLEDYCCRDYSLINKERAIEILMEYSTNLDFMIKLIEQCVEEGSMTVDKKTKKPAISIENKLASVIQAYMLIMKACEAELLINHSVSFENI